MNETKQLSVSEISEICDFIESSLESQWDRYTDVYIMSGYTLEEGMRRMNPRMYDMLMNLREMISPTEEPCAGNEPCHN